MRRKNVSRPRAAAPFPDAAAAARARDVINIIALVRTRCVSTRRMDFIISSGESFEAKLNASRLSALRFIIND